MLKRCQSVFDLSEPFHESRNFMKPVLRSFVLIAAIAGTYCCPTVQAAIIVGTADGFGVDSLTIDTSTGLEWLDWTESTEISFNEINTEFGAGGDFEGFRHATIAELGQFLENLDIGLPIDDFPQTGVAVDGGASTIALADLVGSTFGTAPVLRSAAITGTQQSAFIQAYVVVFSGGTTVVAVGCAPQSASQVDIGHALVRETVAVPEPTMLLCWLGFGLVGLTRRRRIQ